MTEVVFRLFWMRVDETVGAGSSNYFVGEEDAVLVVLLSKVGQVR
jgi:hypothetical protein